MIPRPNLGDDSIFLLHRGPFGPGVLPSLCPQCTYKGLACVRIHALKP